MRQAMLDSQTKKTDIGAGSEPRTGETVPRVALLDAWTRWDWSSGCALVELAPLQVLTVETLNSVYEIVVVSGRSAEILVRGGQYFPSRTEGHLAGSSMGGSFLKLGSIHVGLCMELLVGRQMIVTSPVRSIWLHPPNDEIRQ
jgi:hypothetical protein